MKPFVELLDFYRAAQYLTEYFMTKSISKMTTADFEAFRDGDTATFKKLFFEYQPRVYRFLWLRLQSVETAEDLTQETFTKLWAARNSIHSAATFETYLFKIAHHLIIDYLRHQADVINAGSVDALQLPSASSTQEETEYQQLKQMTIRIIHSLPNGQRTAFLLSRNENLTYKQIAEIMGLSVKTIEKYLSKALKILHSELVKLDLLP